MKPKQIQENKSFVGRDFERKRLAAISLANEASIVVVYGRRRVGKTELIEQVFRKRNLLKFEGIEGQPERKQRQHFLLQLATYLQDPLIAKLQLATWTEIFQLLHKTTATGTWTLFFDEVQWLAAYKTRFIAELKDAWDNFLKQNRSRCLVLCGSSPSFMINKVLHSKALYNRSLHEIPLQEFSLNEVRQFLKPARSVREGMDALLTVGGIPEYLKYLDKTSSIFLGLCDHAFTQGGFFTHEYERVFSSSLTKNPDYQKIIRLLSVCPFATRGDIAKALHTRSGGRLTNLLRDLELCGFVTKYVPFQQDPNSSIARYHISDQYLQFYFKFVEPHRSEIDAGRFNHHPATGLNTSTYDQWLGYSFERYCRKMHHHLASLLGFGAVSYRAGAFFRRHTEKTDKRFQIDLVFARKDKVYTVCEIRYGREPATTKVISNFAKKLECLPNQRAFTIEKVLIAASGVVPAIQEAGYFDRIITLEDIVSVYPS